MSQNSFALPRDNPTSCSYCICSSKLAHLATTLHWELLCSWMIPATVIPETFSELLLSERQLLILWRWLALFVPSCMTLDLSPLKQVLFEHTKRWLVSCEWPIPLCMVIPSFVSAESFYQPSFKSLTNNIKPIRNRCSCTRNSPIYSDNFQLVNKT